MEKDSQKSFHSAVEKATSDHLQFLNQHYMIVLHDMFESGYMQAVALARDAGHEDVAKQLEQMWNGEVKGDKDA